MAEMHSDYLLNFEVDPLRPMELVTVVLRAVALTVMKRCGTVWVEMAKGGAHDVSAAHVGRILMAHHLSQQEDWHSEKADISLYEGIPIGRVFRELDQATSWLSCTTRGRAIPC